MDGKELRGEIDKILEQQKAKGLRVCQISCSLFSKGFKEAEVGHIMGFHPKDRSCSKDSESKGGQNEKGDQEPPCPVGKG